MEDFCQEQTSYKVYIIRPIEEDKGKGKRPKKTWTKVTRTQEFYGEESILKEIKELKALDKKSAIDKMRQLDTDLRIQVSTLVSELNATEASFAWTLHQLGYILYENSAPKRLVKQKKFDALVLYLKRAPLPDVLLFPSTIRPQPPHKQFAVRHALPQRALGCSSIDGPEGQFAVGPPLPQGALEFSTKGLQQQFNVDLEQSDTEDIPRLPPRPDRAALIPNETALNAGDSPYSSDTELRYDSAYSPYARNERGER